MVDELHGDDRDGERDDQLGTARPVPGVGDVDHVAQPEAQGLVGRAEEPLDQDAVW